MTKEELTYQLSDIRAQYSIFDEKEEPKYRALSEVIKLLNNEVNREKEEEIVEICDVINAAIDELKALSPVTPARMKRVYTRKEIENWLYSICAENVGTEFCKDVEEIISRLNGFEKYVEDMRGGN